MKFLCKCGKELNNATEKIEGLYYCPGKGNQEKEVYVFVCDCNRYVTVEIYFEKCSQKEAEMRFGR